MKGESYISLQQTCHNMAEFIQNSRNISVLFDDYIGLRLENGNLFQLFTQGQINTIDIKSLYGIRLDSLTLPGPLIGFLHILLFSWYCWGIFKSLQFSKELSNLMRSCCD